MGMPGKLSHPDVQDAIARVCAAGLAHGKTGGLHVVEPDLDALYAMIDSGYRFMGYALDTRILDSVCRRDLGAIRKRHA